MLEREAMMQDTHSENENRRGGLLKGSEVRYTFIEPYTYFIGEREALLRDNPPAPISYPRDLDRSYLFVSGASHFALVPPPRLDFLVLTAQLKR